MDRLIIKVQVLDISRVGAGGSSVNLVSFGGRCEGGLFCGEILPAAADVQKYSGGSCMLSARYMLEGVDCAGEECRIFIENNAKAGSGFTEPTVLTDSRALAWLNTEKLAGRIYEGEDGLTIEIGRYDDIREERV